MAELVQYYGTGRRKTAIARVFLRPGSGEFKVNGKAFDEYFVTPSQRIAAKRALVSTDTGATFNVLANVCGGGVADKPMPCAWESHEPSCCSTPNCASNSRPRAW